MYRNSQMSLYTAKYVMPKSSYETGTGLDITEQLLAWTTNENQGVSKGTEKEL